MTVLSPLHRAAREFAPVDIKIFPIEAGGKRPVTERGFHDATSNIEQIDRWWAENPNYNIATCPADAGLLVVDIDPGADLSILEKLPPTYTVRTPRGGLHLYYEGTGRTTAGKLAPHVDTRGIGGYVVVPPSIVNGKPYTVEKEVSYAPVPDWVKDALAVTDTPVKAAVEEMDLPCNIERARLRLKNLVVIGDVAVEGQGGDHRTYVLCCELLELGLSAAKAQELIEEEGGWNDHCVPPWSSEELDVKLANAERYMQNEGGAFAVTPLKDTFADAVAKLTAEQQKEEAEKPFIFLRDRHTQLNSPSPEMQIEKILPARKVIMVTGERGTGKTYVALELLTAICMDRPAFGQYKVLKPGPVVAFLGEDPREVEHSRLVAIEKHHSRSLQELFYSVESAIPLDDANLFEKYCDELRRLEKRIGKIAGIFNDTLKRSLGSLNPNDAETGMLFTSVNEKLAAEFDCGIICNAHPRKNGGSEADIAGTGSFVDNVSVTLNLTRTSEKPFDIRCAFEPKYRVGPRPEPFSVRGMPVLLPKPVAGVTTDLVFTALTPEQMQQAANRGGEARAEREELMRALDAFHAHSLANGLTTKQMAEALAGDPKNYKDDDDYRQAVGKHYNRLDQGTRVRKRNGKEYRPKFEAWFDRDRRDEPKGVIKWFCDSPEVRAAAAEERETAI